MPSPDAPAARIAVKEPYERTARNMEKEDRDVLEHADSLAILTLDPEERSDNSGFHGFDVKSRADVPPDGRKKVIEVLSRSIAKADGRVAKCFNPRHGISAKKGSATVDLVICFECDQLYLYGQYPARIPITDSEGAAMSSVFKELGAR